MASRRVPDYRSQTRLRVSVLCVLAELRRLCIFLASKRTQSESALRQMAQSYPYDSHDTKQPSLRSHGTNQ